MERKLNQLVGIIIGVLLTLIGIACIYLLFLTVTAYKPDPLATVIPTNKTSTDLVATRKPLQAVSYNLGFGAHSPDFDYYKTGGSTTRAKNEEEVINNITGIINTLIHLQPDFILLQQIDINSTRSYNIDQLETMTLILSEYSYAYKSNWRVKWNVTPFTKMQGTIDSGQTILSTTSFESVQQIILPETSSWPFNLTEYKPSLLVSRQPTDDGKELVVVNTHLSYPDIKGESIRLQLQALYEFIETEYEKGNYIIVGGTFNHILPADTSFNFDTYETNLDTTIPLRLPSEHFSWHLDPSIATSRDSSIPYKKGESFIGITDGFIVSDNIEILEVKTLDLGFEYSNHHPVSITFELD